MELAGSNPRAAVSQASALLDTADEIERVEALFVLGVAYRHLRESEKAVAALEQASDLARSIDRPDRAWLLEADLAVALTDLGDARTGLDRLTGRGQLPPIEELGDAVRARVFHVRGLLHQRMGNVADARRSYEEALDLLDATGNDLGLGHVNTNLALLVTYEGDTDDAMGRLDEAEAAYRRLGQDWWVAATMANKGWVAGCAGDLPRSLELLQQAERLMSELDIPDGLRRVSRAEVLLKAGLFGTAREELALAIEEFQRGNHQMDRSEALILAAHAAEIDGDLGAALALIEEAVASLQDQDRAGWVSAGKARMFAIEMRTAENLAAGDVRDQATALVERLELAGQNVIVPSVWIAAAHGCLAAGDVPMAEQMINEAKAHSNSFETMSLLTLAEAECLERRASSKAALAVLDRGFEWLEAEIRLLGGIDAAAMAAASVIEIVERAKGLAINLADADVFLDWADRGRQVATWNWPRLNDPELVQLLNQARALADNRSGLGVPSDNAELQAVRAKIRERRWQQRRDRPAPPILLASAVGTVIDLGLAGNHCYVTATNGSMATTSPFPERVAGVSSSSLAAISRLGRLFQTSPPPTQAALADQLVQLTRPIEEAISAHLPETLDETVLLSVDPELADIPWSLLPSLWHRPFSLLPTQRYLTESRIRASQRQGTAVMVGPDLAIHVTAAAEPIAPMSMEEFEESLDHQVVYIAAHGSAEVDSPLFSWLQFDFGKIFLHDLMFLDRIPETVVLAACYAGQSQRFGPGGSASFANGFLGVGARWVVSAASAIADDDLLVSFAGSVLTAVADGIDPPVALAEARREGGGPLETPVAIAFTCYGG